VAVRVPTEAAEEAGARMLALFPAGFEERDGELVAYTDADGERRARESFADVSATPVEPGWEDSWRAFHRPVRIGPLWVGPPWEEPEPGALAVVIDPGRAFGTGAHATTRLCLELLLDLDRGSLVDLGCGSGVVAIAAAKLGFAPVAALDDDPVAVDVARENALRNDVEVSVLHADAVTDEIPRADVAVANIELAAVAALAPRAPARVLVTSGYRVGDTLEPVGLRRVERRTEDGWAADLFERTAA
jgi:ribosomal protein L11 methyltransferase